MSRLTAPTASAASDTNAAELMVQQTQVNQGPTGLTHVKAATLTQVKKRGGRDPDKYTWLPPDPPRVLKQDPLTPVQASLCLLGALILTALAFLAGMGFLSLFWSPAA